MTIHVSGSYWKTVYSRMVWIFWIVFLNLRFVCAQELFPIQESASNVPKSTLGIRALGSFYSDAGRNRNLSALRFMYGITPKLTLLVTGSFSNHHSRQLPKDLLYHVHDYYNTTTIFKTNTIKRGVAYPFRFNGVHVYGKYRFLTRDEQNRHFRMAVYGEYGWVQSAHDEAEPGLMDDTKGWGAGLITSWLGNRWAVSLTSGVVVPDSYSETISDKDSFFPGGIHTHIHYGNALVNNLSIGYRALPRKYQSYRQTNTNLYLEFQSKYYQAARIWQNGDPAIIQTPALQSGWYVEVYPGIQKIIQSNLRFDFSLGIPLVKRSYTHFYPIFLFGVQRYFYFTKQTKKPLMLKSSDNRAGLLKKSQGI